MQGNANPDWLKWRSLGLGASDISVILRSNPYKTPLQLWEEKCGFSSGPPMTSAMEHGIKNEPIARSWINKHMDLNLEPLCVEDDEISYIRASLDGYDAERNVICEIKCPISKVVIEKARNKQLIHDYWFHQMQWQIMIMKPKRAIFAIWDYQNQCCVHVEMFGEENLHFVMRKKAKEFWHRVQIGKAPEALNKDYITLEDEGLIPLFQEYQDLCDREKMIKEGKQEVKNKIVDFGDDGNFKAHGYKVTRMQPRTTYEMEQMRLDGIDIDKYSRKNTSIGFYRISREV